MERDTTLYADFEFNLRELAGSMGDFGTLFPLAIGLITVCGLDPTSLFVMIGLTNIATGLIYRLPMPVEPKKVVSAVAIAQRWTASMVVSSGLFLGLIWLVVSASGAIRRLSTITPVYIIRGIQLALGVSLAMQAVRMSLPDPWLGLLAVALIVVLRTRPKIPSALLIMGLGVVVMLWRGELLPNLTFGLRLPQFIWPSLRDGWQAMLGAGFAQIPLTITNATLATAALIAELFPDKPVSENKLLVNMGLMNLASSFFGGMPMCHGSGGLAGQYYFGARTGGANILEGLIEIALGVLLGQSLLSLLIAFPLALVGGMMLMVGVAFAQRAATLRRWPLALCLLTAGLAIASNMLVGYLAGLAAVYLLRWTGKRGWLRVQTDEL